MRASIDWGRESIELEIPDANLIPGRRAETAPNIADFSQAVQQALENPLDYPPLRRALTPDDRVAIVVDEGIPHLPELLVPLLEHIVQANVRPEAISLVCGSPSTGQPWLEELPDAFQDVHVEVHQPADRKQLAYVATTKAGRRVYLNRTAVDADQLVVLTRRRYDPRLGYGGAELAVYPGLEGAATIDEFSGRFNSATPGEPWPVQAEAREVVWLSGAPFFVQVIEGAGDAIAHILAGPLESSDAGQRLLDARWRVSFDRRADVVIAGISGLTVSMEDLARAAFAATRVVNAGGNIVLLSDGTPMLGPAFEFFRRHDDPALARRLLLKEKLVDLAAGYMWASAAGHAKLYLLSGLPADVAEEIFAVPMQHASQAQRLVTGDASVILLPDAHRSLAVATHA
jgi:nickel-dependent lactate racemase